MCVLLKRSRIQVRMSVRPNLCIMRKNEWTKRSKSFRNKTVWIMGLVYCGRIHVWSKWIKYDKRLYDHLLIWNPLVSMICACLCFKKITFSLTPNVCEYLQLGGMGCVGGISQQKRPAGRVTLSLKLCMCEWVVRCRTGGDGNVRGLQLALIDGHHIRRPAAQIHLD